MSILSSKDYMKLSVIVPTFNRSEDLASCLSSVASACIVASQFPLDMCIDIHVSDNSSSDQTLDTLEAFERVFHNISNTEYAHYSQSENLGATQNVLFLLEKAHGEYILWLTDDDIVFPFAFSSIYAEIKNTEAEFYHTGLIVNTQPRGPVCYSGIRRISSSPVQRFIQLFNISNVFTGTIVSSALVLRYLKAIKQGKIDQIEPSAYPCLQLLALSRTFENISTPLFIHTWGNMTFWEKDVDMTNESTRNTSLLNARVDSLRLSKVNLRSLSLVDKIYTTLLINPSINPYFTDFCIDDLFIAPALRPMIYAVSRCMGKRLLLAVLRRLARLD